MKGKAGGKAWQSLQGLRVVKPEAALRCNARARVRCGHVSGAGEEGRVQMEVTGAFLRTSDEQKYLPNTSRRKPAHLCLQGPCAFSSLSFPCRHLLGKQERGAPGLLAKRHVKLDDGECQCFTFLGAALLSSDSLFLPGGPVLGTRYVKPTVK